MTCQRQYTPAAIAELQRIAERNIKMLDLYKFKGTHEELEAIFAEIASRDMGPKEYAGIPMARILAREISQEEALMIWDEIVDIMFTDLACGAGFCAGYNWDAVSIVEEMVGLDTAKTASAALAAA